MAQTATHNQNSANRKPHFTGDKETYVRAMFAAIAPQYDRMNALLSFNQHKAWRRLAVRLSGAKAGDRCLDICTGTGDFAIDLAAVVGPTGRVIGADFCEPMIRNGLKKTARAAAPITMMVANAEALPYPSETFALPPSALASATSRTSPAPFLRWPASRNPAGASSFWNSTGPKTIGLSRWWTFICSAFCRASAGCLAAAKRAVVCHVRGRDCHPACNHRRARNPHQLRSRPDLDRAFTTVAHHHDPPSG